jgi:hypothetical protein
MPEFALVLALLTALGTVWRPFLAAAPLLAAVLVATAVHAYRATVGAGRARALATALTLLQPAVRLWGRLNHGLTPWRRRPHGIALPVPHVESVWSETWVDPVDRLAIFEEGCRGTGAAVEAGGDFDRFDLQARGGLFGAARLTLVAEEHGAGRQLVRFSIRPRLSLTVPALLSLAALVVLFAGENGYAALAFAATAVLVTLRAAFEAGAACSVLLRGVAGQQELADYDLAATLAQEARGARIRVGRS